MSHICYPLLSTQLQLQLLQPGQRFQICPIYPTPVSVCESAAVRLVNVGLGTDIKLFCLLLSPSNPIFSVDIDKNLTVDDLRVEIKKKMGASFPHYELGLWQVSEHSWCEVVRRLYSGR